ncbi:MAG: hypothetical protein ACM3OB_07800 [Acidobacteriota bacterium]
MPRRAPLLLLLVATLAPAAFAAPPAKPAPTPVPVGDRHLVDRILAVVDGDPILLSDVQRAIGLGVVQRQTGETDHALYRRVLDLEIAERLRFHEVDRLGFTEISPRTVEETMKGFRARFASDQAFADRLRELGLTTDSLKQLVVRQLMVLTYVEERLGARIFVTQEDIRAYYDSTLAAEMKRRGQPLPPIDDVREQVRQVLREQRLNDEIGRWTTDLRQQADVVDNLESVHQELPPVAFEVPARPLPSPKP